MKRGACFLVLLFLGVEVQGACPFANHPEGLKEEFRLKARDDGKHGTCAICNAAAGEHIMKSVFSEFNQADVDDSGFVDEKELFQYATRNALEGLSCPDVMDNDKDDNPYEELVMFIPQAKYTDMQHYVGQLVDLDDDGQITIEEWDFVYYFLCDSDMSIDADGPNRDSDVVQYADNTFNLIEGCEYGDKGIQDGTDNLELKLWVHESFESDDTFKNQNLRDLFKKDGDDEKPKLDMAQNSKEWLLISPLTKMWIDYGDNEGCCGECTAGDKAAAEKCKKNRSGEGTWQVSSWYCTECYTHTSWMPSMRDDSRVDTLK